MLDTKFHFFVNVSAGRLSRPAARDKVLGMIEQQFPGAAVTTFDAQSTTFHDDLAQAADQGHTPVAVGGDGSISRMCSALMAIGRANQQVAIVPMGTGNDAARSFGLPLQPLEALKQISDGSGKAARPVDLLEVRVDGQIITHGVTLCAMGLPATVIQNTASLGWLGSLKYTAGTLASLFSQKPSLPTVKFGGATSIDPGNTPWLVGIANGSYTGGGMKMVPHASINDGWGEAVVLQDTSPLGLLTLLIKVFSGAHVHDPKVIIEPATGLEAQLVTPAELIVDGEVHRVQGNLSIQVRASCLHLVG